MSTASSGTVVDPAASVVDADPTLESLILESDPSIAEGATADAAAVAVDDADAVNEEGDPILLLSQDQISRLQNVLQSEEAKGMLGQDLMADILSGSSADSVAGGGMEGEASQMSAAPSTGSDDFDDARQAESGQEVKKVAKGPPKRRSQRQIDRELKEEADRIRLENQALMRKEQEEAERMKKGEEESQESENVPSPAKG